MRFFPCRERSGFIPILLEEAHHLNFQLLIALRLLLFSHILKAIAPMIETNAPFNENLDMQHIDEARQTANDDIFRDVDVLILPTMASEVLAAKAVGDNQQALSPQNTFFANYYALPAVSVPCGFDENGLPVGLQIVGQQAGDRTVLHVAQAYQRATKWHENHPAE